MALERCFRPIWPLREWTDVAAGWGFLTFGDENKGFGMALALSFFPSWMIDPGPSISEAASREP